MASSRGVHQLRTSAAFTLIELVLTVALVLLLAGAVILSLGPLDSYSRLEEGATQVETLFRFARAQSAYTGRQVKITFGHEMPGPADSTIQTNQPESVLGTNIWVQVLWEPDPVGAPGRFERFPAAEILVESVNDLVKVEAVGQPGAFSLKPGQTDLPLAQSVLPAVATNAVSSTGTVPESMPPLVCYPDGSSDSMELLLSSADEGDQRHLVVDLWGMSGRASHRVLTPAEDAMASTGNQEEPWP